MARSPKKVLANHGAPIRGAPQERVEMDTPWQNRIVEGRGADLEGNVSIASEGSKPQSRSE